MGCLHLQFAERLPSAQRREIARTDQFGQLEMRRESAPKAVHLRDSEWSRFGSREIFSTHCLCFQVDTRASFSRQENFFVVIEN
jgi:hypothetical protein